ncbi:MAG: hypothetical protein WCK37_03355 [Candidatus Falkowbacteria bacterium]
MKIQNLNNIVNESLVFFSKNYPSKLDLKKFSFPLVIGSGNAYNTGLILFNDQPALFANESNLKETLNNYNELFKKKIIKDAIIISASGAKDSVWEIKAAKKLKLNTTLLTCEVGSEAAKTANKVIVYKKLPEPYSYNVSTYLGMILSKSQEDPKKIISFIKNTHPARNFKKYTAIAFIVPDEYAAICHFILAKADEIFGPHVAIRAFTAGDACHAKFINRSTKELVISFGKTNNFFGEPDHRLDIELPKYAGPALMFCLVYALLGKVQELKPAYFKKNIKNYCTDYGPKAYGHDKPFTVIVPGN